MRLTHPVKREEAINAAEQGKGMSVMLLHQFSVSLTHCQSSLTRKTHEEIRHTAAGQQWTGMSCVSKGHLWTDRMLCFIDGSSECYQLTFCPSLNSIFSTVVKGQFTPKWTLAFFLILMLLQIHCSSSSVSLVTEGINTFSSTYVCVFAHTRKHALLR